MVPFRHDKALWHESVALPSLREAALLVQVFSAGSATRGGAVMQDMVFPCADQVPDVACDGPMGGQAAMFVGNILPSAWVYYGVSTVGDCSDLGALPGGGAGYAQVYVLPPYSCLATADSAAGYSSLAWVPASSLTFGTGGSYVPAGGVTGIFQGLTIEGASAIGAAMLSVLALAWALKSSARAFK